MRSSPHTEDWKLTLVQISERCRLTWHEHDQWKMTPSSWPVSSVRKAVRRLSYPFRSIHWFKIIFCRLRGNYFVVELKVQSTLFWFSVNSKLGRGWIISARVSVAQIDCKTAVFFANASDGPYSNERLERVKKRRGRMVRDAKKHTPCGRVRLARFTLEDHAYGTCRLPKTTVLQSIGQIASLQATGVVLSP